MPGKSPEFQISPNKRKSVSFRICKRPAFSSRGRNCERSSNCLRQTRCKMTLMSSPPPSTVQSKSRARPNRSRSRRAPALRIGCSGARSVFVKSRWTTSRMAASGWVGGRRAHYFSKARNHENGHFLMASWCRCSTRPQILKGCLRRRNS